ncbi:MAG: helix-turn-helix domain-containing protein, partial [Deltaproteobacteria bacterium]
MEKKASAEKAIREIRRKTRRRFSAEEKIRIVIEGLRGEESIASLCRREGIAANRLLPLEQGVSRSGQEAAVGRYAARGGYERSRCSATGKRPAQGAGGRDGAREPSAQKKRDGLRFARGRGVRVSASEKIELIRLVEGSSLPVRRTLAEIGLARSTFYAGYKRYLDGGLEALEDRKPAPQTVWNRIPDRIRAKVIETALVHTELSPRELACRITDREGEFLSESSVYRILKAADLIESPAYILLQAADRFQNPTRR